MPTRISRYCEGLIEAAWLAAIALVPLFFNVYSSRIFEPDKITLLRSLALLILAAWVIKVIDEGRIRWEKREPGENFLQFLFNVPLVPVVIGLALLYLVSTLFSVTPRTSLLGSYQRLQGTYTMLSYLIIFAAIAGNLRRRVQVERIITTAVLVSLPVSFYGILQRFGLDPIPWGGDTVVRIAANLGNSIFVAAYLIMVAPLTIGRMVQSFMDIWKEEDKSRQVVHAVLGTAYAVIAALQVTAIYLSGSRGPALGWMSGMYVLALLLALRWRKRTLGYAIIASSLALGLFLFLFNLQGGPLEGLRASPAIGRFGRLLDSESNSAKVRRFIWQGAAELVAPHDPIEFPDGSTDRFNFLRPLIGYGPESMYVAYNPFYVPELGQVERRNASPDRSHNETWDALVITGVLGAAGYLAIFLAVFYYALKWLGLVAGARQRQLFWLLAALGGLAGGAVMWAWSGAGFLGVGIPFGIALGLMVYLFLRGLKPTLEPPATRGEAAASLTLIVLVAAVMAHFVEINFGIAISATRTYFWTYAGLILAVGWILPRLGEYSDKHPGEVLPAAHEEKKHSKASRKAEQRQRRRSSEPALRQEALVPGVMLAVILSALAYNYLSTMSQPASVGSLIVRSLTYLPNKEMTSLGLLGLVLATLLAGALLLPAASTRVQSPGSLLRLGLAAGGVGLVLALVYWLFHAGALLGITRLRVTNIGEIDTQARAIAGLLTGFYIYIFLLLFGLGWLLQPERGARLAKSSVLAAATAPVMLVAVFILVHLTNIRVIQADSVFKLADNFNRPGQWAVATHLYKTANRLAPAEDHYYLFLGRNYLEQAKESDDPAAQEQLVQEARADLLLAQRINPLNTDHTANLARLYTWWAPKGSTPEQKRERAQLASDYYADALKLSPQNSTLWGEWALLYLEQLNDPREAHALLTHALELDQGYSWTQGLMGDYYARTGRSTQNPDERLESFQQAVVHYNLAVKSAKRTETQIKISNLVSLAGLYIEMEEYQAAVDVYEQAIAAGPRPNDLWRIQETLARLYAQMGEKEKALELAAAARSIAPQEHQPRIDTLISQLEALP
jgi:tetratricopeptide (TPR) repeat protein/O-antigen ligase